MRFATFLIVLPTLPLLACSKAEAAPATQSVAVSLAPQAASAAKPTSEAARGEQVYRQTCAFCHEKGIAGAPKTGDVAAWSPRLAQGMETLYASALHGKNAMPARGGNPALADSDVKTAVDYLAAQSR